MLHRGLPAFLLAWTAPSCTTSRGNLIRFQPGEPVLLSNGWTLSPAGRTLPAGDLPLNMAVSKSGRLLAVTNNGQSVQSIQLIDRTEKLLDRKIVAKSWVRSSVQCG